MFDFFKKVNNHKTIIVVTLITISLIILGLRFFNTSSKPVTAIASCSQSENFAKFNTLEIQSQLNQFIPLSTVQPTYSNGALSENIGGYISVRFQNTIYYLIADALENKNIDTIDKFFKSSDYSFAYQNDDGSFQFIQPKNVQQKPTEGDLLSGSIFYLSSFALSLNILNQSDWFNTLPNILEYKTKLEIYKIKLEKALSYIEPRIETLIKYDKIYSNRLFFDALTFIASSNLIPKNKENYLKLGQQFLNLAFENQSEQGYFLEKDGFDSSYQGVSLNLLYIIYSLLPSDNLLEKISCAQYWLSTKILTNGEIVLDGNSRVGGEESESFLGEKKSVAAKDVASSFYKYYILTSNQDSKQIAESIKSYYR